MPQTVTDEVFDQQGNLVSSKTRQVPLRVVSDADLAQVKATIKNMMQTFYPGWGPDRHTDERAVAQLADRGVDGASLPLLGDG